MPRILLHSALATPALSPKRVDNEGLNRLWPSSTETLHRADGEADEAGEDAEHAEEFFPRVGFFEEKQAVGKAYHGSAATNRTHDGYQAIRIAKRQHIDVVADDEKQAYQDDNACFLYGVEGGRRKAKGER